MDVNFAFIPVGLPNPARVYDFWLGGHDNFRPDRDLAEKVTARAPNLAATAPINRRFGRFATTTAVRDHGIRQVLDLGCGFPAPILRDGTIPDTHETVTACVPEREHRTVRVLSVDKDPTVVAHVRTRVEPPFSQCLRADLGDTPALLGQVDAEELLDRRRPVAILAHDVIPWLGPDDAHACLAALRDWAPPGSVLSLTHTTADFEPDAIRGAVAAYASAGLELWPRTRNEVTALFGDWTLPEPGVTAITRRQPDPNHPPALSAAYAGIAVKPPPSTRRAAPPPMPCPTHAPS